MDIIALLEEVIKGIYEAQKDFFEEPKDLYGFEKKVTEVFRKGAAGFIGLTLSEADKLIEESAYRKMNYKVQRHDERTLITTAGEVRFRNTEDVIRCLMSQLGAELIYIACFINGKRRTSEDIRIG